MGKGTMVGDALRSDWAWAATPLMPAFGLVKGAVHGADAIIDATKPKKRKRPPRPPSAPDLADDLLLEARRARGSSVGRTRRSLFSTILGGDE